MSTVTHQAPAETVAGPSRHPSRLRVSPQRIRRIRRAQREHSLQVAKPWRDPRNW